MRNEIEHFFEAERIHVDMIAETQDTSLLKALAQDGKGLVVLAENAVREELSKHDKLTQAVTIFALLEMHKKGEATWSQRENCGAIEISSSDSTGGRRSEESA